VTAPLPPVPVPCSAKPGLLSEGPRWDADRDELLWVDIVGSQLHRARLGADGLLHEAPTIQFDRFVVPGFKRSLQHLDEKELRWRCASEGQIGLLER
jgi:sugar lactone lactonase YvrE